MSLFDRHLNPLSPAFLVVLVLAGIAIPLGQAAAQENVVNISVVGNQANRRIELKNRGSGICGSAKTDCASELKWKWIANSGAATIKKIKIEFVKGTNGAFECLVEGGVQKTSFELEWPGKKEVTATVHADCPAKSAWIYRVRCEKADGTACAADPVDPGVIIDP